MKRTVLATALLSVAVVFACPVSAQQPAPATIGMLPPTPIGSTAVCPSGTQQILSYSGAPNGSGQAGINCVPITTDAAGDISTNGYLQLGGSSPPCDNNHVGVINYNSATRTFQGCNGSNWQNIGGGGLTIIEGGCQTNWSGCPAGYTATSYFSPGTYNCCDKCGNPAWRYTVCSQ